MNFPFKLVAVNTIYLLSQSGILYLSLNFIEVYFQKGQNAQVLDINGTV